MSIEGMDKIMKQLTGVAKARGLAKGVKKATLRVERTAKQLSPVLTGFNKASINSRIHDTYGEVVAGTDYASHLEFGTYKMAAQPFMFPAINKHRQDIIDDIKDAIRKEML